MFTAKKIVDNSFNSLTGNDKFSTESVEKPVNNCYQSKTVIWFIRYLKRRKVVVEAAQAYLVV